MDDKVYIVLLNWNGWRDTIECLESVFRNNYHNYTIIVCDNDSSDDSLNHIKSWADGHTLLESNDSEIKLKYCLPPVEKPVSYISYSREEAEVGGQETNVPLVLIQTGENLGFAGGNNVGMRYVMARNDYSYMWLLNNDTVIDNDALTHLVRRMKQTPDAGMCGSTLVYYNDPGKVQAAGGASYFKWLGIAMHLGRMRDVNAVVDLKKVENSLDYIIGASMLVSRPFMQKVGLMDDSYFLYFEEIDWAVRAKPFFSLVYAPESHIYHKVGGSIGSHRKSTKRSDLADYYLLRNRLRFTRKFYPFAIPTVYMELVGEMLLRAFRGQWGRAGKILKIMTGRSH